MTTIQSICVYCGSGEGRDPAYVAAAEAFGRILAEYRINLVYGGGNLGLMGRVAAAAGEAGSHVTGIIPEFLSKREGIHRDVDELIVVPDMHTRKRLMFEKSDAFVALPGGIGTLEETVEMLTWHQLGQHRKPLALANINGFWNPLIGLFGHMREENFIRAGMEVSFVVANTPQTILPALEEAIARHPRDHDPVIDDIEKL
ncbi:MAG: TIGR00730 family Rossman fold protein [Rhodobiaceae bacterium]|nr:TIGR00730 family Rossman fold protein [Rhodobiaceae bacterium]MCC0057475.1 TIGR00730 family Rossman fold protein [Rhodobiaceae bacterium]